MEEKFYNKFGPKKKKPAVSNQNWQKNKTNGQKEDKNTDKTVFREIKANAKLISKNQLFNNSSVPSDAIKVMADFDQIIQGVRPLNSRQLQQLPENVRNLSHQMTDDRSVRRLGYMNENVQLSAYVRYFTWWNLVRLTKLFSNLSAACFPNEKAVCLDLGSGPLTVVTALWLARPELREKELTWYCLDVSANSLSLGEELYLSVAAKIPGNTWKIIRVKGSFGTFIKEKADFVTCANMFNELDQASDMPPEYQTKKYYDQLKNYAKPAARFILVEPGVPKAARTLSLLRDRFIKDEYCISAPCPHAEECSMNGFKAYTGSQNKWCNFAFNTEDAPKKLQTLSTSAKLPKERAVLSFVTAIPSENPELKTGKNAAASENTVTARIASDGFKLPGYRTGHYACSKLGLVLISSSKEELNSGDLLELKLLTTVDNLPIDGKSGAKKLVL